MKRRELNMKPSFSSELMALPASEGQVFLEKINMLVQDPLPDGHLKKKLKGKDKVYRLRMGKYRIFYTFGDDWIRLLALRRRSEETYGSGSATVRHEAPGFIPDQGDDLDEAAFEEPRPPQPKRWTFEPAQPIAPPSPPLPREITPQWLESLQIPATYFATLAACDTEDALLNASAPNAVITRVLDNLYPRPIEQVLEQPDLVVQEADDLMRFQRGELHEFLLRLDPQQEKLCGWALKGPTMVKGGPGTGKSTVALYRARETLERPGAPADETVLFTTYTRALARVSSQLLDQLLSPEQRARVEVCTIDQLVRRVFDACGEPFEPAASGHHRKVLRGVLERWMPPGSNRFDQRKRKKRVQRYTLDYLLDEFRWVIEGRQLESLDAYLEISRAGRGVPFHSSMRESVWSLHQTFLEALERSPGESWEMLRQQALEWVSTGRYSARFDQVIVDEAQDLSPVMLSLLAELVRDPEGIFLAADVKQSIHTRGQPLQTIHPALDFKGRTRYLRRNYRSTEQIESAAASVLLPEDGDEALGPADCVHTGPSPVLVRCDEGPEEARWAARFIRQMSRHLRLKPGASGVLVPTAKLGELIAEALSKQGVAARFYKSRDIDLSDPEVKVITLHSAKGLEFPTVVLCGLDRGTYPDPEAIDAEELTEATRDYRRLLYVGMTRAMRGLMVIYPHPTLNPALEQLDLSRWSVFGDTP